MAYIRTCVQNLGEIRRPVRNNCPSSLIIDQHVHNVHVNAAAHNTITRPHSSCTASRLETSVTLLSAR